MKLPLIAVLLAVCLAQAAAAAPAQLDITSGTVSMMVPSSAFDPSTGNAQVAISQAISGRVKSSGTWSITVRSGTSTFSNGVSTSKPISDLGIRASGGSQYQALSTSNQTVASGNKTKGSNWADQNFDLNLHVSLLDGPGNYTAILIFTILAHG